MVSSNRVSCGGDMEGVDEPDRGFTSYRIPPELFISGGGDSDDTSNIRRGDGINDIDETYESNTHLNKNTFPRGGYQGSDDSAFYYDDGGGGGGYDGNNNQYPSPYDLVREEQLQQLHEQLQQNQPSTSTLTTYTSLLDRVFGLTWSDECSQIRQTSPFGKVVGWGLASFILKAGEDVRREALVMQVISKLKGWFDTDIPEHNRPFLKPYSIMCVGGDAGLLECVRDSKSIDEVKKETDGFVSLRAYFERAYGPPSVNSSERQRHLPSSLYTTHGPTTGTSITFEKAQDNFLRSLVGYSLVCYILQIKDRHNANILLDRYGHLLHIDFGFVLGDTPKMGKIPIFSERAPFKLTAEFWDVIGGWNFHDGGLGVRFCKMFEAAFVCAAEHTDEIATLVEAGILNLTRDACDARALANGVRRRLRMRGGRDSVAQKTFIMDLVNTALNCLGTSTYDWLQKSMNGYI